MNDHHGYIVERMVSVHCGNCEHMWLSWMDDINDSIEDNAYCPACGISLPTKEITTKNKELN